MDRVKLTKARIAAIEPTGKQFFVWDSDVRGFGLRVTPAGKKSFIMQRRVKGKTRRVTIARADDMHPETARDRATKLAVQFGEGIDPVSERRRLGARAMTLGDAFAAYKLAPTKKGGGKGLPKKPRTILDIEKAERRLGDWRDMLVTEITGDMVKKKHMQFAKTSPAQANLIMR